MEALVGKVDGKLVEGIGPGRELLGARKVEKADKGDEIIATETFVECSLSHENKIKCLRKVVTAVGCAIWIKGDCAEFLLDELGLVRECGL